MDLKKSPKADLEHKRGFFLQIGLVVALVLTLVAFEWKSYDKTEASLGSMQAKEVIEEIVLNTQQEVKLPPPPPAPQTTVINVVKDNVTVDDNITIDAESNEKTEVQYTAIEENETEEMEIFSVVEESPDFPGGDAARIRFLQEKIRYPQIARESGIQGTVYVTFVVEKDGSVTDVRILRGIGGGCDEEAIRVIKSMPKWKVGKQRGKPVRVQFNMPIKFTLQG